MATHNFTEEFAAKSAADQQEDPILCVPSPFFMTGNGANDVVTQDALDSIMENTVAEIDAALRGQDDVEQTELMAAAAASEADAVAAAAAETTDALAAPQEALADQKKNVVGKQRDPPLATEPGAQRAGRWDLDEKILFLYGLQKYGKGRWKKIRTYVPGRYVRACVFLEETGLLTTPSTQFARTSQKSRTKGVETYGCG